MAERESIIADLQQRLWAIEGIGLVERNLEEMGDITKYPAVFIVDIVDQTTAIRSSGGYEREWVIQLHIFFKGTNKNAAPGELDAFRNKVKAAMRETGTLVGKITGKRGSIEESAIGGMLYGEQGNHVLIQWIEFKIYYIET